MDKSISLIEINDSLRPCPLCGRKVRMTETNQGFDGRMTSKFCCECGLTAELEYYPPDIFLFGGDERNRLLPWEQWNRRYDDA